MTAPRQVVAGRTYLMSRRCTQRHFFLRPDAHGEVEQIYLYCLAEAAQRFDVTLHGFIAMSNHQHIVARDNLGNFPMFLAHLDRMIAKVMNVHLGRTENFWATTQPNAVYLVEASDRFDKLVYLLANPVTADLVDRVSDWPGACSLGLNLSNRTQTIKRPRCFFRSKNGKMPEEVTLRIERPEGFEGLSDAEWIEKVREAVRIEEERARDARMKEGRRVLGRKAVLETSPTDRPSTEAEPRGKLRPHIACKNRERRIETLSALVAFRIARRRAFTRTLNGETDVAFPLGTYRVWRFHHAEPPPIAA